MQSIRLCSRVSQIAVRGGGEGGEIPPPVEGGGESGVNSPMSGGGIENFTSREVFTR